MPSQFSQVKTNSMLVLVIISKSNLLLMQYGSLLYLYFSRFPVGRVKSILPRILHLWVGQSPTNSSNVLQQRRFIPRSLFPHRHLQFSRVHEHNRER